MALKRASVQMFSTRTPVSGWRGAVLLGMFLAIVIGLPEARALLIKGVLGGIVIGVFLILIRHHPGPWLPRRGTPIVLFAPDQRPVAARGTT